MPLIVGPKITRQIMRAGSLSSSVHRLWIGGTGLAIRPAIDYYNRDVDPETRKYSAAKTAVKVAITVFNGVLTRVLAEEAGLLLIKRGIIKSLNPAIPRKDFAVAVATVTSFLATVFTTFTLDIPLINSGLNFTLEKLFPGKKQ